MSVVLWFSLVSATYTVYRFQESAAKLANQMTEAEQEFMTLNSSELNFPEQHQLELSRNRKLALIL